jgi:GNAT superfamily N-acetyltransferase
LDKVKALYSLEIEKQGFRVEDIVRPAVERKFWQWPFRMLLDLVAWISVRHAGPDYRFRKRVQEFFGAHAVAWWLLLASAAIGWTMVDGGSAGDLVVHAGFLPFIPWRRLISPQYRQQWQEMQEARRQHVVSQLAYVVYPVERDPGDDAREETFALKAKFGFKVIAEVFYVLKPGASGELTSISVRDRAYRRGYGIGRRLVAESVRLSLARGFDGSMDVVATTHARKFYEKLGFEAVSAEHQVHMMRLVSMHLSPEKAWALLERADRRIDPGADQHTQPSWLVCKFERAGKRPVLRGILAPWTLIHELGNLAQAALTGRWNDIDWDRTSLLAGIVYKNLAPPAGFDRNPALRRDLAPLVDIAPPCWGGILANLAIATVCVFLPSTAFVVFGLLHLFFAGYEIIQNLIHLMDGLTIEIEAAAVVRDPVRDQALTDFCA